MPKTYSSYLDTIGLLKEIVEGLSDALGINKTHFQARVTGISVTGDNQKFNIKLWSASFEYQTQRIKLAFNKTTRQELFEEFGAYNTRLRDILGSSDRLAGLRRARVTTKTAAINSGLSKLWNHANNVFCLLTEAWTCRCQTYHHANLLLQHRVSPIVDFQVAFLYQPTLEGTLPWTWQNTYIKLLELEEHTISPGLFKAPVDSAATDPSPAPAPQSLNSHRTLDLRPKDLPTHKPRSSFRDKFRSGRSKSSKVVPLSPITTNSQPTLPVYLSDKKEAIEKETQIRTRVAFAEPEPALLSSDEGSLKITDLCATICQCSEDLHEYGILKAESLQYTVAPLCVAHKKARKFITLDALLSKNSPIDLSRRQRYHIALILASSHVQLHPTPWLKSKWNKKDISFLYDEENNICLEQPYISRSMCRRSTNGACDSLEPHIFQDSIRNLGIVSCTGCATIFHQGNAEIRFTLSYFEMKIRACTLYLSVPRCLERWK